MRNESAQEEDREALLERSDTYTYPSSTETEATWRQTFLTFDILTLRNDSFYTRTYIDGKKNVYTASQMGPERYRQQKGLIEEVQIEEGSLRLDTGRT